LLQKAKAGASRGKKDSTEIAKAHMDLEKDKSYRGLRHPLHPPPLGQAWVVKSLREQ
jgi:hypothetical protein